MAAIGSLIFCTDCGNLLPASKGTAKNILHCECCGAENPDIPSRSIVTRTKASDFPSPLRQKLSSVQTIERHKIESSRVDPNMDCSECGRNGIRYTELQTRGADEGSTIMYNCECGHKWNMNN
ncbi:hypothetical protein QBC33DRAFT_559537 [Phialemonium atrogriseum]|uniref:DNA-directed RNA polymerase subunit n=1 Tax=Phialemonium atrogriseum TaxID=1093897 RepID=A0AAJ0BYV0_9PEZI|nr:uncharacterized protein QBC33DRAFT_559537 [Phialemonium atrogriseum]KAK1766810.1 hypothetical protein QBC33DRAFT_559537 [Phialemonium atrogriseum]